MIGVANLVFFVMAFVMALGCWFLVGRVRAQLSRDRMATQLTPEQRAKRTRLLEIECEIGPPRGEGLDDVALGIGRVEEVGLVGLSNELQVAYNQMKYFASPQVTYVTEEPSWQRKLREDGQRLGELERQRRMMFKHHMSRYGVWDHNGEWWPQ